MNDHELERAWIVAERRRLHLDVLAGALQTTAEDLQTAGRADETRRQLVREDHAAQVEACHAERRARGALSWLKSQPGVEKKQWVVVATKESDR